jgi:hypothetical protein
MTTPESNEPDPVAAAVDLTTTFQDLTKQFARLQRSDKRLRRIVRALAITFALDLALTIGLGYSTLRQNEIQASTHAALVSACRKANGDRAKDAAVWGFIINIPASPSAARRNEVNHLGALVRSKDTLRDCATLYP